MNTTNITSIYDSKVDSTIPELAYTQLSSRGQIVIPKIFRDANHWGLETKFIVRAHPEGILLTPTSAIKKTKTLNDLVGCVKSSIKVSLAEIDASTKENYGQGLTSDAQW